MSEADASREQRKQSDENTDNQPALRVPKVDRQRDLGSGLDAGTDIGVGSEDLFQNEGGLSVGPGADPHGGTGDGSGIATGQFQGSDNGTTTEQGTGVDTKDGQQTDLALDSKSSQGYRPDPKKDPQEGTGNA